MVNILHDWKTTEGKLKAMEGTNRNRPVSSGSQVSDLASLQKCITLCENCAPKFDPTAYRYERLTRPPYHNGAIGECDGCMNGQEKCFVFMPIK